MGSGEGNENPLGCEGILQVATELVGKVLVCEIGYTEKI